MIIGQQFSKKKYMIIKPKNKTDIIGQLIW